MRGTSRLTIIRGLPGYDTVRQITERFAREQASVLTSSDSSILTQARDILASHEQGLAKYMDSVIEIKPLGQLVGTFCDFTETPIFRVANREHQAALIASVASIIEKQSPFYHAKDLVGFHEAVADLFQLMRWHQVNPETLSKLAGHTSEATKLWTPFEQALAENYLTTLSHRIEAIRSSKPAKPKMLRSVFWIGETEWRPLAIDFVKWMLKAGIEIVIATEIHPTNENFYPAFQQLKDNFSEAAVETLEQPPLPQTLLFGLGHIEQNAHICTFEAADEVCEVEWAIRSADLTIRQSKDARVCIFCRNLQDYGQLLSYAAKRLDVTLNMARTEPLHTNSFARLCAAAIGACTNGSMMNLAPLALSSYSAIPMDKREEVADIIRNLSKSESPWSALVEVAESHETCVPSWFAYIARWRDQALQSELPLAEWIKQFQQLVSVTPWLDEAAKNDAGESGERDQSAMDAIIRNLETSKLSIARGVKMSLDGFFRHLMRVFRNSLYWVRSKGEVKIASAPSEIGDASHVFAIGLIESKFPKRRAEDPLLLDEQIENLRKIGFNIPNSFERADEERRVFHRVISAAPNIFLSWPQTFAEEVQIPSSFLIELENQCPNNNKESQRLDMRFPRYHHALTPTEALASIEWYRSQLGDETTEQLIEALPPHIRSVRQQIVTAVRNSETETISDPITKAEISQLPQPLYLKHLRALKRCPFQYLAAAKLNLKPRRPRNVWERLVNVVRRTDLVTADTEQELMRRLLSSLAQELDEARGQATEEELDLLDLTAPRVFQTFVTREFAARLNWGVSPISQNTRLRETRFRKEIPYNHATILLDERIDILYQRNDDYLPIRLAYVPDTDDEFEFEAGLLFILAPLAKQERMSGLDSLQKEVRKVLSRATSRRASALNSVPSANILVTKKPEPAKDLDKRIKKLMYDLITRATQGDIKPTPGDYCSRCGYASLCRKSTYARPFFTIAETWYEENS